MTDEALLKRQKREIEELRKKLEASGVAYDEEEVNNIRKEMLAVEQQNQLMALQLEEERAQHRLKHQELEEQSRKIENLTKFITSDKG
eukprot:576185-Prorocentrum_minimum.AAC.1